MILRAIILAIVVVSAPAETPTGAAAHLLVGDRMPEGQFLDSRGKAWGWSDFRGKPVALTFIFTRCPAPDFCPRMTRNFAEAERALAAAPIPGGWQLVSLTVDPAFDTPEVMATYAAAQRADMTHWIFATGEAAAVARLAGAFGAAGPGGAPTHLLRTVVVGADGRIRRILAGNEWRVEDLVAEMRRAAK